jgi:hypothetical protein
VRTHTAPAYSHPRPRPRPRSPADPPRAARWKQRDIHEKRQARNQRIAELQLEIPANTALLERLSKFSAALGGASDAPAFYSHAVERLQTQPSPEAPETPAQEKLTYDEMLLRVLGRASDDAKTKLKEGKADGDLGALLVAEVKTHVQKLGEAIEGWKKELKELESEKSKKITTEDMHDGWDSKVGDAVSASVSLLRLAQRSPRPSMFPQRRRRRPSPARTRRRRRSPPPNSRR